MATRAEWHPGPEAPGRGAGLRYTHVAMLLHWLIALAIVYNLASGLLGSVLPGGFFIFHVSSGISILVLSVVRVIWRLTHKPPPFLAMKRWEHRLAHVVHGLLYAAMLLLPLSGWALVSAHPPAGSAGAAYAAAEDAKAAVAKGEPAPTPHGPPKVWGLFTLPPIAPVNALGATPAGVPEQQALHERIEQVHLLGGWVMLVLLILHVGGALKHQFVDRERELARMGIGAV